MLRVHGKEDGNRFLILMHPLPLAPDGFEASDVCVTLEVVDTYSAIARMPQERV